MIDDLMIHYCLDNSLLGLIKARIACLLCLWMDWKIRSQAEDIIIIEVLCFGFDVLDTSIIFKNNKKN